MLETALDFPFCRRVVGAGLSNGLMLGEDASTIVGMQFLRSEETGVHSHGN